MNDRVYEVVGNSAGVLIILLLLFSIFSFGAMLGGSSGRRVQEEAAERGLGSFDGHGAFHWNRPAPEAK